MVDRPEDAADDRFADARWDVPDDLGATGPDADFVSRIRTSLNAEANTVAPRDRLAEILAQANTASLAESGRGSGRRFGTTEEAQRRRSGKPRPGSGWVWPLSAAAAVALIAGGIFLNRPGTTPNGTAGGPAGTATVTQTVSAGTLSTESPAQRNGTVTATLPAYRVAVVGTNRVGLVREFVDVDAPALDGVVGADELIRSAIHESMSAGTDPSTLDLWAGVSVTKVVHVDTLATVYLDRAPALPGSLPGISGVGRDRLATLGIQQLVWSASGAVQEPKLTLTFVIADGSRTLFGTQPAAGRYVRPEGAEAVAGVLAPIWILAPNPGAVLPAGRPVVVSGDAMVFEANVNWEYTRAGETTVQRQGSTRATLAAPERGAFSVDLGVLAPGDYRFTAYETSMADGSRTVSRWVDFTVA